MLTWGWGQALTVKCLNEDPSSNFSTAVKADACSTSSGEAKVDPWG